MGKPIPLLIVSDAISGTSGLSRIARDLAIRIHAHLGDVYHLATAGYAAPGSARFGIMQYALEGISDWVLPTLRDIWEDHAQGERGVILFIWDACRTNWFAQPKVFDELLKGFPTLQHWLENPTFEKWIYTPVDAGGPPADGRLTLPVAMTLAGFDRILAYGQWAENVIRTSIGNEAADKRHLTNLPHGIDGDIFTEMPNSLCRKMFIKRTGALPLIPVKMEKIAEDEILIGIVATNNGRKDWALGIETVALLAKNHKVRLWVHTDGLERAWSIPALVADFGLLQNTVTSICYIPDERMAEAYSACDLTLGIGPEGFGYPIHESLFCGTPCITGNYAGAPEWMNGHVQGMRIVKENEPDPMLVEPIAFRTEGVFGCKRPVFAAKDWAAKADAIIGKRVNHNGEIDWNNLWPRWEAYLREAVKERS